MSIIEYDPEPTENNLPTIKCDKCESCQNINNVLIYGDMFTFEDCNGKEVTIHAGEDGFSVYKDKTTMGPFNLKEFALFIRPNLRLKPPAFSRIAFS